MTTRSRDRARIGIDEGVLGERLAALPPGRLAVTRGSAWADAAILPAPATTRMIQALLQRTASGPGPALAWEIFRGAVPGRRIFLGMRGGSAAGGRSLARTAAILRRASAPAGRCDPVSAWRDLAGASPLFDDVQALELGVVDRWVEEAPVELPRDEVIRIRDGGPGPGSESLAQLLAAELAGRAPHLRRQPAGPVAVEIRCGGAPEHWIGMECSARDTDGRWRLDGEGLVRALDGILT